MKFSDIVRWLTPQPADDDSEPYDPDRDEAPPGGPDDCSGEGEG